ncbi:IS21 family transposase [Steroidobacter cummioxidans]|uniref:IS21 family transposase n=1 Tax=Steroidobacter cummioxidans TaxID=1803913 RepID=UPI000E3228F7|nr:IS21 family transposase [Steroidobacter cummioxidans]
MPTRALTMRKIRDLIRLKFITRLSHEQIARALSISKGVVAKYAARIQRCGIEPRELLRLSDAQVLEHVQPRLKREVYGDRAPVDCARVHTELKRPGVTLTLLWQEYAAANAGRAAYRFSQFALRYHTYVASLRRSMRQIHRAGEKLFIDYAGQSVPYGSEGQRAQIFVAVLGASNYTFACATAHQRLEDWIGALVRALTFIGGVPQLIVPDNARAMIAHPDRYEPRASLTVQDLAHHYDTAVLPARPRRPQDKAKVEVALQVVERWILARLRDHRFQTLEEVDGAIGDLLDSINTRAFRRLPGSRKSAYELLDRSALRPLPASPYEFARYYKARVNIDYHVSIDEHFYSVPHALVHQDVEARVTATAVEVLHRGQRVAAHRRSSHRFAHTTVPEHMPAAHRAHLEWSPARLIRWGAQHGPACAQVIERILTTRKHPEQGYRACLGLLKLEKHYGAQRLEAACVRALALGSPAYQTVASILKRRVESLPLADEPSWSSPEHAHLRGPKYYQ